MENKEINRMQIVSAKLPIIDTAIVPLVIVFIFFNKFQRAVRCYKFLSPFFLFNYPHITDYVCQTFDVISYIDRYNYAIYFKYCSLQGRVISCCDIIRPVLLALLPSQSRDWNSFSWNLRCAYNRHIPISR
jgi:hypothetical protein